MSIWYGEKRAIDNVSLDVASNAVTAIIGPSGCGKSTFLRALNRMHELTPKTRMEGTVLLARRRPLFEHDRPRDCSTACWNGFSEIKSVSNNDVGENVVIGLRLNGVRNQKFLNERLERSLRMAALVGRGQG